MATLKIKNEDGSFSFIQPMGDNFHKTRHELGGQDELDITKLKGYQELDAQLAQIAKVTLFPEINAIIEANTTFSDGVYTINTPIVINGTTLNKKKLTLQFASEIKFKVADTMPNGAHAFQFLNFDYIQITGLKVEGNLQDNVTSFSKNGQNLTVSNTAQIGNALVWINDSERAIVENCDLNNTSYSALFFKRVNDVTANNNVFLNSFTGGITASACFTKVFIQNNLLTSVGDRGQTLNYTSGGIGILVSESENVVVQDNRMYGWSDTATKTEGCNHVRFINNDVTDFGKDGIKVMGYPASSYGDRTKVLNAEIKNNYIKNRYDGRPDGSSYVLMHDVTNGIIDGNTVIKDNAQTGTHDGIRVNNPVAASSSNIKVINNVVKLNGDYRSFNIDGKTGSPIKDVAVKNNTFSVKGFVIGVSSLEIEGNNFIDCDLSLSTLLQLTRVQDVKIANNTFAKANLTLANILGINVNFETGMEYIDILNNSLSGVSHRGIDIRASATLPVSDRIGRLRVENNTINDFATQTVSFPVYCIGVLGNEVKVDMVKIKNNTAYKTSGVALDAFYWFHNSPNQKATVTEYENNLLNSVHAELKNSHPQMGRIIGKPVMTAVPTYITDFLQGDVIYKKTTANDKVLWKLLSGVWTESY